MIMKRLLPLFIFSIALSGLLNGQGLTCEESEPFCTGTIYTFPAGTNGNAQPGPNYGCLGSQPAPAWYHMLIDAPGDINIHMFSEPLEDIDFICWGPFNDPFEPCPDGLVANTIVDCSYSPQPQEDCYIPNGQTGQYYILLITNYSRNPCNITFQQTSGSGTTDCTILPPPVGNNSPICDGQTLELYADTVPNATYYWTGPNGFLSTIQNPVIIGAGLSNAGDYACTITVNSQSSDPAVTTAVIYDLVASAGPDQSIPFGTSTQLTGQVTGGGFNVNYAWEPPDKVVNPGNLSTSTVNLTETTLFTLTVTDVAAGCVSVDEVLVSIEGGAVSCSPIAAPTTICSGETSQLQALASGGSGNYTYSWSSDPGNFTSDLPNPVVSPTETTTYFVSVNDGFNTASGQAVVAVNPLPVPDAGTDQAIANGAFTTLNGSASAGSGNYSYQWEPADKLVNPNVPDPETVNLFSTTLFSLTVIDESTGCVSEGSDQVTVTVSGDILNVNPVAEPQEICGGQETQLFPLAGGGSGNYTFTWSGDDGFSSDEESPVVTPMETTVYTLWVDDGFNSVSGSVTVYVNAGPEVELGPADTIVCVYDTLELDAGNPGSEYLWFNGSTERKIKLGSTGIGYDMREVSVMVTDPSGCRSEGSIRVFFDFSYCFGITEHGHFGTVKLYPNPNNGSFRLELDHFDGNMHVSLMNLMGLVVYETDIRGVRGTYEHTFNVQQVPEGVYFIKLTDNENVHFEKLIIRR